MRAGHRARPREGALGAVGRGPGPWPEPVLWERRADDALALAQRREVAKPGPAGPAAGAGTGRRDKSAVCLERKRRGEAGRGVGHQVREKADDVGRGQTAEGLYATLRDLDSLRRVLRQAASEIE